MAKKEKVLDPEKEKKKEEKRQAFENGEGLKAKLVTILVFILVLAGGFGGLFALVKTDTGGFATECLAPVIKDIPIVNMILPEDPT